MKILIVSLFLPMQKAKHAGGRYVFELIRNLSQRHDVYLATRLEEREVSELEHLKPFCSGIYSRTYPSKEKRNIFDLIRLIINYISFSLYADRLVKEGRFDLLQAEWTEAALLMRKRDIPMVLDAHDVITKPAERMVKSSKGVRRLMHALKYMLVKRLELGIARRFDCIFTRSEYDRQYLLSMDGTLNVEIIPHPAGLDITGHTYTRGRDTILFLASYKYRKVNVDAALYFYHSVFPLVRREIPDTTFIIAGYGPPNELLVLQENDPSVIVTGFVDDIDKCYKEAAVFVAPILVGGGIIVKILDAMAAGAPVVTTPYGNEGIGAVDGHDMLIADTPKIFALSVIRLLNDPSYANNIAENGQEFVRRNYSMPSIMHKIESAYSELMARKLVQLKKG